MKIDFVVREYCIWLIDNVESAFKKIFARATCPFKLVRCT